MRDAGLAALRARSRGAPVPAVLIALALGAGALPARASVNSYRFLHVTIDTPWHIFLFLLMGIFAPFILMVVLMWRNSTRKREIARRALTQAASETPAEKPPAA